MNKVKVSAAEAMRITEKNTDVGDVKLARNIFTEIMQNPTKNIQAWNTAGLATAMFMAGYISGIRTEREKRRKKGDKTKPQEG